MNTTHDRARSPHMRPLPLLSAALSLKEKMNHSYDRDSCPDYNVVMSRSNSNATTASRSVHWETSQASHESALSLSPRRLSPPVGRQERYIYTYDLLAAGTPLQFFISAEPASGRPTPGKCTFRLSFKANGIERMLCEPVVLTLFVDPRHLEFVVFLLPGSSALPAGSNYRLRVWLRVNGVETRLFDDDELLVGKDLDFQSIAGASFMRLKKMDSKSQVYHGFVGQALVTFICRWKCIRENLYRYAIDYETNGFGATLVDDIRLRIDGDPRTVSFLIYSLPISSTPAGSSHRVRVWLKSLCHLSENTPTALPFHDSYIYQRLWKSDMLKIGSRLDFAAMGNRAIMGFMAGAPVVSTSRPVTPPKPHAPTTELVMKEKDRQGYQS